MKLYSASQRGRISANPRSSGMIRVQPVTSWVPTGSSGRRLAPRCRAPGADRFDRAAVTPYGELVNHFKSQGISAEEAEDVFSKLHAAGYTEPVDWEWLETLDNAMLKDIGIEPQGLRTKVLIALRRGNPGKTLTIINDDGNVEEVFFQSAGSFEAWAIDNVVKRSNKDKRRQYIKKWTEVADGGTYYTSGHSLAATVQSLTGFEKSVSAGLEEELAERAVEDMRANHKEAERWFCGVSIKTLMNRKTGATREFDEIIVADNCVKVVEAKHQVDRAAVEQLDKAIEFIKVNALINEADFRFARHADGTLKEIKGAIGGLTVSNDPEVMRRITQKNWDLYTLNGARFGHSNSCCAMPAPAKCNLRSATPEKPATPEKTEKLELE